MQGEVSKWPYWLGGIGIALGLLCLGYIVMETIGKKVLKNPGSDSSKLCQANL